MFSVPQGNRTQALVEQLGASIVARKYPMSVRALTAKEVCEEFKVSRSIAREALTMLASKGLLATNMSQGTWVQPETQWNLMDKDILRWLYGSQLSKSSLKEFLEVRRAIEPLSASYAANRISQNSLIELRVLVEKLNNQGQNWARLIDIKVAIHKQVLAATKNNTLNQFAHFVEISIRANHRHCSESSSARDHSNSEYASLVDHIAANRTGAAKEAIECILKLEGNLLSAKAQEQSTLF